MTSDWQLKTVGAICSAVFSGGTPTSTNAAYYGGRIPWLRTKEVNYKKILGTSNHITPLGLASSSAKLVPVNSVIVAMYGNGDTAGRVAINKVTLTTNQACCNLVVDPDQADYRFVYYYLMSKYQDLVHLKNGGAQQNLNGKTLKGFPIAVPDLGTQRAIANILESMDESIDLLTGQNTVLESIAQTLFRSWFVDFDPIHTKLAGNEPEAMSAELAALFPSEFEDSELGSIPKGWAVTTFGAAFDIKGGGTPSTKEPSYWDNGTHSWATPKDMSNLTSKVIYQTAFKLTTAGVNKISSKVLPTGTTLMSSRAPVGYLAIAKAPISINQGFIAVPPTEGISPSFIVNLLLHKMPEIKANAGGTTFAEISKSQFRPIKWVRPSKKVMQAFGRIAEPLYASVHANCLTIDALAALRDHLLPRLISGKLRLEDAEATFAAITSELEAEPA